MSSLAAKIRTARIGRDGGFIDAFAYEAKQEPASALGHTGKQLENALHALERHDANPGANTDRDLLVWEAADRAMALMIQREAFGLYASRDIETFYNIPREVMLRMGTPKPSPGFSD